MFGFLRKVTPFLLSCSNFIGKFPLIGSLLKRIIPVANYNGILPLSQKQQLEWSLLDTFDWLSPEHDHPQTQKTIKRRKFDFTSKEDKSLVYSSVNGVKKITILIPLS